MNTDVSMEKPDLESGIEEYTPPPVPKAAQQPEPEELGVMAKLEQLYDSAIEWTDEMDRKITKWTLTNPTMVKIDAVLVEYADAISDKIDSVVDGVFGESQAYQQVGQDIELNDLEPQALEDQQNA